MIKESKAFNGFSAGDVPKAKEVYAGTLGLDAIWEEEDYCSSSLAQKRFLSFPRSGCGVHARCNRAKEIFSENRGHREIAVTSVIIEFEIDKRNIQCDGKPVTIRVLRVSSIKVQRYARDEMLRLSHCQTRKLASAIATKSSQMATKISLICRLFTIRRRIS